jgi:hypothetical protein
LTNPQGVAVSDGIVYVAEDAGLDDNSNPTGYTGQISAWTVNSEGTGWDQDVDATITGLDQPEAVTATSSGLYWSDFRGVWSVPLAASTGSVSGTVPGTVPDGATAQVVDSALASVGDPVEVDQETGAFEFADVPVGDGYRVQVTAPHYETWLSNPFDLTVGGITDVGAGLAPMTPVTFGLTVEPAEHGTVATAVGSTNYGGSLSFMVIPDAHYDIENVQATGGASPVDLTPGSNLGLTHQISISNVTAEMTASATFVYGQTVSGKLPGKVPAGATAEVLAPVSAGASAVGDGSGAITTGDPVPVDEDGTFSIPGVPDIAGSWVLVTAPGYQDWTSGTFSTDGAPVANVEELPDSDTGGMVVEVPGATTPPGGGSSGTTTAPSSPSTPPAPPAVTAVKVKAAISQVNLVKSKSYKIVALAYAADGSLVTPVTFQSSNPKVATVAANGKVKALKPGKTVVTASAGGQTAKVKVTVLKKKPAGAKALVKTVTVKLKKSLKPGQVVYLAPKLGPKTALAVKVTFKSTKAKVAKVDKAGRLQALKKGKATIKVKAGKVTKKLNLKVK